MGIGILLLLLLTSGAIYAINFLVSSIQTSLETSGLSASQAVGFNLKALRELGIITEPSPPQPEPSAVSTSTATSTFSISTSTATTTEQER